MTPTRVKLLGKMGNDRFIAYNAWLSTGKHRQAYTCSQEEIRRLVYFLMRGARKSKPVRRPHASPFGHPQITFLIENAPIFVAHQWERHRTMNFSEASFRYDSLDEGKSLADLFYMPDPQDIRGQVGFPGDYEFPPLHATDPDAVADGRNELDEAYATARTTYHSLLRKGWAPELARTVLPVGTLTDFTATASLRNWLNFLVLRATEANETLTSQAQLEIRQPADDVEKEIAALFPLTYEVWTELGRPVL